MDGRQRQLQFLIRFLKLLYNLQAAFALLIFFILAIESFGIALFGSRHPGNILLFISYLFLSQSGVLFFIFYLNIRKTPHAKDTKAFLIPLTISPLALVVAASLSFLFEPFPSFRRAYSLAFLFLTGFSWIYLRSLLSGKFSSASRAA